MTRPNDIQAQIAEAEALIADLEADQATLEARLAAERTTYEAARASRDIAAATQARAVLVAVEETLRDIAQQIAQARESLPRLQAELSRAALFAEAVQLAQACATEREGVTARALALQELVRPLEAELLKSWWAWSTAHARFQAVAGGLGLKPSELVAQLEAEGIAEAGAARVQFFFGQSFEDRFQVPHAWPGALEEPVLALVTEAVRARRRAKQVS
ncbi:MAG: hypothetical protein SFU83_18315 [Meiothermus sp.]|nr:hypothetical protein [Meiothermus sp.]